MGADSATMMSSRRILLIKTSSMGDIVHTLPALSDAVKAYPEISFDWCVEEGFSEIPRLHPAVRRVIPTAWRRWRQRLGSPETWRQYRTMVEALRFEPYHLVIDAQGLLKSAWLMRYVRGEKHGFDRNSIREKAASWFYQHRHSVSKGQHAIKRNRRLFGAALGYEVAAQQAPDYGVRSLPFAATWLPPSPYAVLLTACSGLHKQWPHTHWLELGRALLALGISLVLPAATEADRQRCQQLIAAASDAARGGATLVSPPEMSLTALEGLMAQASFCIGVDTGLTHLAAASATPTVALFVGSSPLLTGIVGRHAWNLGSLKEPPSVAMVARQLADMSRLTTMPEQLRELAHRS